MSCGCYLHWTYSNNNWTILFQIILQENIIVCVCVCVYVFIWVWEYYVKYNICYLLLEGQKVNLPFELQSVE